MENCFARKEGIPLHFIPGDFASSLWAALGDRITWTTVEYGTLQMERAALSTRALIHGSSWKV